MSSSSSEFSNHNTDKRENKLPNVITNLNTFEKIFIKIHNIIIWQNPMITIVNIIIINLAFWLSQYLDFKFYGIVFSLFLLLILEQLRSHYSSTLAFKIGASKNDPTDKSATEARIKMENDFYYSLSVIRKANSFFERAYNNVMLFRQSDPGGFCSITCICFLLLSAVGNCISSTTHLFVLLMLCLTLPGIVIHFLPSSIFNSLKSFFFFNFQGAAKENGVALDGDDYEMESFLLNSTEETLEILKLAGEAAYVNKSDDEDSNDSFSKCISGETNDDVESVSSKLSFYSEWSMMPSPSPDQILDVSDVDSPPEELTSNEKLIYESEALNWFGKHFDDNSSEEEFALEMNPSKKRHIKMFLQQSKLHNRGISKNLTNSNLGRKKIKMSAEENDSREHSSDTDSFEIISEKDM